MKHIIIDARIYGPKHTGIGRYTKNLILHLSQTPGFDKYRFSLIVDQKEASTIKNEVGDSYQLIPVDIRPYSLKEQLLLPFVLYKHHPDLVHFTHFNKPIFYFGKSVVTIHDLIKHFYKGKQTTTRHSLLYWPKYLAYLVVTFFSIKTNWIIVPSNFWRQYLINKFKVNPKKIITTHEAVDPNFKTSTKKITKADNYIIYTGNLYPHKNVEIIFKALKHLPDLSLKIICSRDIFQQRAFEIVKKYSLDNQVEFLGYLPDIKFKSVYAHALALVHPSFMEGFSLTGLEAMALSCPVISSNSSCLPEIYQKSVLYFDPHDDKALVSQIKKLQSNPSLRQKLIKQGHQQVSKYSWSNTANLTLDFYDHSFSAQ